MKTSLLAMGLVAGITVFSPGHARQDSLESLLDTQGAPLASPTHQELPAPSWYELRSFSIAYLGGKQYEALVGKQLEKDHGDHGYKNHEATFTFLERYFGLSRGILSAFGYAESLISQPAVSWANAQGIMQIHPTGYWGAFRQDYDAAQKLVERYVDEQSLEQLKLDDALTEENIRYKRIPTWKDLDENLPEIAMHLKNLYSLRDPRKNKIFFDGTPSDDELEAVIRHVYAPYYNGVGDLSKKYFEGKTPSYEEIIKDATKNIVLGSLIFDLGRRQLSLLTVERDGRPRIRFRWAPPGEDGVRAIHPQDLDLLTYGPYNAGVTATKYRLKVTFDSLLSEPLRPLRVRDVTQLGKFYTETRRGITRIKRWLAYFDSIPNHVAGFVKKQSKP